MAVNKVKRRCFGSLKFGKCNESGDGVLDHLAVQIEV